MNCVFDSFKPFVSADSIILSLAKHQCFKLLLLLFYRCINRRTGFVKIGGNA